jgi:CubicO group peptidase (beta-lactamase class C family)
MVDQKITTANWGGPPYNRWSFQNVQLLFPTARIRRGTGPVVGLDVELQDLNDIAYEGLDGGRHSVAEMIGSSQTDSFLVAKNGTLLCEQYFNGMAADSFHLLNSVTKSYVGMLAGILIERGQLQVNDQVTEHVPDLLDTAFSDTTIRHLLDMSAAVEYGEDYAEPEADFWLESAVVGWRPALRRDDSATTLLEYAKSLRGKEQIDGEKYHYRTVLTNVLGMVLERVSGRPLQELLQTELWSRLGPEQDAAIVVDRTGFPYVGAGMNACARDLARFGQMMVQQGSFNGEQIVPTAWISDTRYADDHARAIFAASEYGEFMPGGHYRNKVWVRDSERGVLIAIGIHGQIIYMDMSNGVVIVKLSSQPESADIPIFSDTFAAMAAISDAI